MKSFRLNGQVEIPVLGLGTWKLTGEECVRAVTCALEVGYRHIDTADVYGNHEEVGQAVKISGVPRGEIFITTKIPRTDLRPDDVVKDCDRYLTELDISYIDLLLIHWPNRQIPIAETLGAMDELKKRGKIRAIGVSNFTIHHLRDVLETGVEIVINQVELHPTFNQKELHTFCISKKIVATAYSPLGRGADINLPLVSELAQKYNVSPAQVILNWIMSRGIVAIPKSASPSRVEDNLKALSWKMEKEDIRRMDSIPQEPRLLNHPGAEFDY